jgi:ABC-type bacteriocin/lantibiotic exporter with double-glycine peptidase domain
MRAQIPRLQGSLILEGISFGYSRLEEPFIRDFSLELQPGQRIALVGGSGSGKTTIAHLVCGLYEPWEGRILFDGRPRSAIPREVLVSSLARVSQDIHLFAGSCSDNIAMWDATIPEAWIQEAAEDACIRDLIGARKDGFASQVGEAGCNFSGGERQRMEIARALATHPRILLLDEATSALDPVTEARIDSNLRRRGCTCLIVAHRLSTIRDCDEIIVMDKGRIAERGTHETLVARGGRYAALVRE